MLVNLEPSKRCKVLSFHVHGIDFKLVGVFLDDICRVVISDYQLQIPNSFVWYNSDTNSLRIECTDLWANEDGSDITEINCTTCTTPQLLATSILDMNLCSCRQNLVKLNIYI